MLPLWYINAVALVQLSVLLVQARISKIEQMPLGIKIILAPVSASYLQHPSTTGGSDATE